MEIAGKLLVATDGLYFVADCVCSNCKKSKSGRGVTFGPSKLLGRAFACSKLEKWERCCACAFPCGSSIALGCVVFKYG
uniref:Uncharacterized protein n=1 Tax=Arundo donax TaxID=35708 RepID=A0A0A8XMU1_ARUDO